MRYSSAHETSDLRTYALKRGAQGSGGWVALLRCLRPQALPDTAGQRPGRAPASDSRKSRVWLPDGAQRHPRLQPPRPGRPTSRLVASQRSPRRLRRERGPGFTRDAPPGSQEVRQREQFVDPTDGRRGELRRGHNRQRAQWRNHPGYFGAFRGALGAGQALDREPRSRIRPQKGARDRLIRLAESHPRWAVGFEDETWFSRFERPSLRSWADATKPMRLLEKEARKDDPEPKALSCYGLYLPEMEETWLRFVDGRPMSAITTRFLGWCCHRLQHRGKEALLLIWDNATWHKSHEVREWIIAHNREVKAGGREVRIVPCLLPTKSPWLNAIEPQWIHGKRKVVEPERLLGAYEDRKSV